MSMCCRELLWTLSDAELNLLEKSLCSTDDVDRSSAMLAELSGLPPELLLSCEVHPLSDFYGDDLSDTDDGGGVMVHSESTMTVVSRPAVAESDEAAATLSATSESSLSEVLTDAEARRLHHSKSWPQSDAGRRVDVTASMDSVTTSAVTVYGNQQFYFNLPQNTSTDCICPDTDTAAAAGEQFADQCIIYLSSPTSSVDSEQQIAYVTDELCRIFCTDTASLEGDADGDNIDIAAEVPSEVAAVELFANDEALDVSASVQQQCLEVISCECESSVDNVTVAPGRDSSVLIGDVANLQSVSHDVTECLTAPLPVSHDHCCSEEESSCTDSEESSLTVNVDEHISPPVISELSADALTSDDEPVSSFLSAVELPSVTMQASSSTDDVPVDASSSVMMSCANNSEDVTSDAVAVVRLHDSCHDVHESTVADSMTMTLCDTGGADAESTPSLSADGSSHHHDCIRSSPTPVIDSEAAKLDCSKHQIWNCSSSAAVASNGVELSRDHERLEYISVHYVVSLNEQ